MNDLNDSPYIKRQGTSGLKPIYSPIASPFDYITGRVPSCQFNYRCRELELNLVDCTDVFGRKAMVRECKDIYDDYWECLYSNKSNLRVIEMKKERLRQYVAGERSKKDLYAENPPIDTYRRSYGRTIG